MIEIERFERDWTWPTYWIVKVVVILFAIIIAYPYIPGSETAAFKGITILLGVILSFGSTSGGDAAKASTGFSFGSASKEGGTGFSFGDKKPSAGFSFGSSAKYG